MPFETVELNDGRRIPQIAFGTGSVFREKDITTYILNALHAGFTHIDTAQIYQNEDSVGRALKESGLPRNDLWITTKFGRDGDVKQNLLGSLKKIGTSYVDLYLIHHPDFLNGDIPSYWTQFEHVHKEGLAKSIGVSNFTVKDLKILLKDAKITPAVNQINFSPYKLAENKELLEFCAEHSIVVEAYSSLAPITRYPGGPVDKPVQKAAERLGATPAQVLLSWVRSKGIVIVTTTSQPSRLDEYLDAGDLPALTPEEIKAIDEAGESPVFDVARASSLSFQRIKGIIKLVVNTAPTRLAQTVLGVAVLLTIGSRVWVWSKCSTGAASA